VSGGSSPQLGFFSGFFFFSLSQLEGVPCDLSFPPFSAKASEKPEEVKRLPRANNTIIKCKVFIP